jgi:hypothetical protein
MMTPSSPSNVRDGDGNCGVVSNSATADTAAADTASPYKAKVFDIDELDQYLLDDLLLGGAGDYCSGNTRPLTYLAETAIEVLRRKTPPAGAAGAPPSFVTQPNTTTTATRTQRDGNSNKNSSSLSTITSQFVVDQLVRLLERIAKSASLQSTILKFITILVTQASTPAVQALNLDVVVDESTTSSNNKQQQFHWVTTSSTSMSMSFQRRLVVFAILDTLVPYGYDWLKQKALIWIASSSSSSSSSLELGDAQPTDDNEQQRQQHQQRYNLIMNRRRLMVRKLLEAMETIIPILRLGVLLRAWRQATTTCCGTGSSDTALSPILAMVLSGLLYRPRSQDTSSSSTTTPRFPTLSTTTTLFVLYAHRRWIHHECMKLWQVGGEPLIQSYTNISQMITYQIRFYYQRIWRPFWRNQIRSFRQRVFIIGGSGNDSSSKQQSGQNNDDVSVGKKHNNSTCPFCHLDHITVPYEMENCGHVACYTCLWNYIRLHHHRNHHHLRSGSSDQDPPTCPICDQDIQHCRPV